MATGQRARTLGPADDGRLVSADEFASWHFEEPWTYERTGGRLVVMSPDGAQHDDCSEVIRDHLGAYKLQHPEVIYRVISEAWIRVDDGTDRIADIGVYLAGNRDGTERPDRVPDLVFEVVSPDRASRHRDYVEKQAEYHRLGVLEYVIVDRFAPKVTVLTHRPGGYSPQVLGPGDSYTSPLLPGFAVPLAEVF